MPTYTVLTAGNPERYRELVNQMPRAEGPAFLEYDQTVAEYWPLLRETFPDNQFCLVDEQTGAAAGVGNCIPLAFEGDWADLPPEGLDWVLSKGFADRNTGKAPNLVGALYIEVAETHRGMNLSAEMLRTMRGITRSQGFGQLIAPVRPSLKSRYPLIDIATYLSWITPDGLPFDPWLRVHARLGARVLHPCRRAMVVLGTREAWAEWAEMAFPGDGDYVIPYGLVPVQVREGLGEYIEPGVWVLHEIPEQDTGSL